MVTIEKAVGNGTASRVLTVPTSAYDNFYKGAGWRIVSSAVSKTVLNVAEEVDEWDGYDDSEEEITKPLSEMNRTELEEYAAKLGVDLSGLTSNKQYREAIKSAM